MNIVNSQDLALLQPFEKKRKLLLASGRASKVLAEKIAARTNLPLLDTGTKTFTSGEIFCNYGESIRDADLVLVQSITAAENMSPNDSLMELLLLIDAARRAAARRITVLLPYYGYCRQDKKSTPREPISAALIASLLENAGADCIVTMDLHAGQLQGFFHNQAEHLTALYLLGDYVKQECDPEKTVIVSPDAGRVKLTQKFAKYTGLPYALLEKQRPEQQKAQIGYVIGDVAEKCAIIVDDIIDTGGTLKASSETLVQEGATSVFALATHGVLSGNAFQTLQEAPIERIVVTDTIPLPHSAPEKFVQIDTSEVWAKTMVSLFLGDSVSQIFNGENQVF